MGELEQKIELYSSQKVKEIIFQKRCVKMAAFYQRAWSSEELAPVLVHRSKQAPAIASRDCPPVVSMLEA